ncbi:glycosyltransferase family 4 protein [Aurantibacter sp.]|uniref:glycosyltransferase family 4 protein n=1 Tax=Aurantibacter sp. TaxID=2807103 RepID=UPI0035C848B5
MKKKIIRITTISRSLNKLLGTQIDYIKNFYDLTLVSQNDENGLVEIGKKKNLPIFELNLTRKITPIKDLNALIKLIKFLKTTKPEIVHTHTPKAGLIGMMAAKIAGVKNRMHTVAGMPLLEANGFKLKLLIWIERLTYACANKVYFNSKGLMQIVLDKKISRSKRKFKVIGNGSTNGVNTEFFSSKHFSQKEIETLKKENNIKSTDKVFLFVGRIVKDKGVNELVSAFKKLTKEIEDVKLVILGRFEQDLNPVTVNTTKEIENNPNILFLGYRDDVRPYFVLSDMFVFPSYREGFPNVVMQAGAMGLPSIVSNINGSNEIITNNINGTIVKVKDESELFIAMKDWCDNPEKVNAMTTNARSIIIEKYDQQFVAEQVLKEYNSL